MKTKFILSAVLLVMLLAGCAASTDSEMDLSDHELRLNEQIAHESEEVSVDRLGEDNKHVSAHKEKVERRESTYTVLPKKLALQNTTRVVQESRASLLSDMSTYDVPPQLNESRENYASLAQSDIKLAKVDPVSTFSIDVDTGSYTNIRRMLNQGVLPPANAVRVEEMINYFNYHYPAPSSFDQPFNIHTELAQSPWSENHVLLKVGLKAYDVRQADRKSANLVFLLDVSGSMNSPRKLPLLKRSLTLLSKQLNEKDSVSIVVYAGASGVVLEPTKGNDTFKIEAALDKLSAGGSTNGRSGIELAYQLAKQNFIRDGINRVLLATDGDFNVGMSDVDSLKSLIESKRKDGITLTTLGFGTGNYNDHLMEQLANVGNGNYAYIDSFSEARKVLVEELNSTLMTIAKDVKVQIEFNPEVVKQYRLIGYENRALAREDFNNDRVDAGEVGAGHTVTALYELVLQSSSYSDVDPLRYQPSETNAVGKLEELAFVKCRYKSPTGSKSKLMAFPIAKPDSIINFSQASEAFMFSATVAHFGEVLRQSKYIDADYKAIINNAIKSKGIDKNGYRSEFIQLVQLASDLSKG